METNRTTSGEATMLQPPKLRNVEPQSGFGMMMPGMPFNWVFAFAVLGFVALMAAFYAGHKFSAPQNGIVPSSHAQVNQHDLKKLIEEASKSKGVDAGMLERIDALGTSIAKIERDFNERSVALAQLKDEVVDGRKVLQATLQGMATSSVKGSGTMLDMTQTFDGEFKAVDTRFAEVATLLASIRDKQTEVAGLRKVIGDGNDASKVALLQLNEKVNALSAGVTQLAQVVRTKLPNPEDLKFGADFPPPANQ